MDARPDDIVYRVICHVADTDDEALEQFSSAAKASPRGSLTFANKDLERAIDEAGYYGRDREAQRQRLMPRGLQENIEVGSLLLGSPDTVVSQIERIHRDLGAGILDLTIAHDIGRVKDPSCHRPDR